MRELLTIGQFSQLTHITVRALRLYDRLGVLRPAVVDLSSRYRYYSPEQTETAARIALLRSLDMPLTEIRALLAESDAETLRDRLFRHRQRVEQRMAGYRDGLALLETLDSWAESVRQELSSEERRSHYECGFCGKVNSDVTCMIAGGNGGLICDECVMKCERFLEEQSRVRAEQPPL